MSELQRESGSSARDRAKPARNGRRELNKIDKLKRITNAARAVFTSKGYDEATAREIARRAKVALGTVFTYAANKRDLLFLVVNDDFEKIGRKAAASVRADVPVMRNLLSSFRPLYEFFAKNPSLSRLALREMLFYETGPQARRFGQTRRRMTELSSQIIRIARDQGEIRPSESPDIIGQVIFSVYQFEVRQWLSGDDLDVESGMRDLKRALAVVIVGCTPVVHRKGAGKNKR